MKKTIRSKAPLRLSFGGGGTDVSPYSDQFGGYVLNATIDKYAYCTLEFTDQPGIVINSLDQGLNYTSEILPKLSTDGPLALHKGVYNRIVREFIKEPFSFKMTTHSDAVAGSGLGGSSTLVVAILKAFIEAFHLPLGEYDAARIAYEIEREELGFLGGKQDQYAATFGGFNFMEFYSNKVVVNPLRIKNWIVNELESSLLCYFTGISRDSSRIIQEQIKNTESKNESSLGAMHVLKENCISMKETLLRGDLNAFAEEIDKGWIAKKKMAAQISNDTIDSIYSAAKKSGAKAGKVSGAGGGGYLMFIVDPLSKLQVAEALQGFGGRIENVHFTHQGTQAWHL